MNRAHERVEAAGARLFFVGQATPKHAAHFRRRYSPEIPVLADEDRETYKLMGLPRGGASQLIGPKSVAKGLARIASNPKALQGRVIGDAAQLGGTFLVLPSGEIPWSHPSSDASDNASAEEIVEAVKKHVG